MQIGTNLFFDRSSAQLGALADRNATLQTQIGTGKRLAAPSDDAVAYRRLQTITRSAADDATWTSNISHVQTVLSQADSTLGNVTSQLQRAQELVVQANNGTLSDADRATIATELRGIIDDLVGLANTKDAHGQPLFGSATGDTAVTVDAAGVVSFTGTGDQASVPVGDGLSVRPSESAARIFGGISAGGSNDVFALLSTFASALESGGTVTGPAATAIDGLKTTLDQVSTTRGSIGARGIRLDLESSRIENAGVARESERSALEDTDISKTIIELQKTSTILQATQASLSKLSQLSLFDYLR
ncbi:MAG: flagellar hook-associated protein 3 [Sphingomonas sp. 28-66-16]|nr:MAG: flagellar hook-associated protein 3 [Sphingomonas sp. 28-66-16]